VDIGRRKEKGEKALFAASDLMPGFQISGFEIV
jgi:hypothetical protein